MTPFLMAAVAASVIYFLVLFAPLQSRRSEEIREIAEQVGKILFLAESEGPAESKRPEKIASTIRRLRYLGLCCVTDLPLKIRPVAFGFSVAVDALNETAVE